MANAEIIYRRTLTLVDYVRFEGTPGQSLDQLIEQTEAALNRGLGLDDKPVQWGMADSAVFGVFEPEQDNEEIDIEASEEGSEENPDQD